MPPLPLKFTDDASNTIDSLERRSRFLQDDSLPKLLACKGPLVVQQNLAEELREDLGVFSRQIESLSLMIDDQSGERARKELKGIVQKFTDELHELRAQTRIAILTSKKAVEAHQRSNRDELFSNYNGSSQNGTSQSEKITEDAIMKANADVTEALRRTITAMQSELEKSVLSNQLLETSTAALRATSGQHDTLTTAIETSKHLVTALEKADWLDRLLIMSAFVFFLLVVLFILKQRFVDRGIRLMFWWTRFIPDFSGDAELLMQEEGKATVTEVVSSVATAAAVTASSVVGVVSSVVASSQEPALSPTPSVVSDPVETLSSSSVTADVDSDEPISTVLSSIISSSSTALPSSARTRPTEHVEL